LALREGGWKCVFARPRERRHRRGGAAASARGPSQGRPACETRIQSAGSPLRRASPPLGGLATGRPAMNELYLFEQAQAAYDRMTSGKAPFRVVLRNGGKRSVRRPSAPARGFRRDSTPRPRERADGRRGLTGHDVRGELTRTSSAGRARAALAERTGAGPRNPCSQHHPRSPPLTFKAAEAHALEVCGGACEFGPQEDRCVACPPPEWTCGWSRSRCHGADDPARAGSACQRWVSPIPQ
jgi:hypothetical protein